MRHIILYFACMLGVLLSCSKEGDEIDTIRSEGYFPLHVGNEWDYINDLKVRTDSLITINGKEYYRFIRFYSNFKDTIYYRNEENKIYENRGDDQEYIRFDLNSMVGDQWEISVVPNQEFKYTVTLKSSDAVVETESHTFNECLEFYYDVSEIIDEEMTIFLAEGIGMVQESGSFIPEPGLKRVVINGNEITF